MVHLSIPRIDVICKGTIGEFALHVNWAAFVSKSAIFPKRRKETRKMSAPPLISFITRGRNLIAIFWLLFNLGTDAT